MSISSINRKAGPYSGNDVTVAFPFAFKVFTTADVVVVATDAANVETILALGTNYSISLNSDQEANPGGTVTMLVAPATGTKLTLTSDVADLQPVTLTNNGGFYPRVINDALDRATIQIQQLKEKLSRALVWPISAAGASLPGPEASKFIGWNATADSLVNLDGVAVGDAQTVSFDQAGTGAVTRTSQDKMRESVSVKDFGAVGNGVANDTAAIQAAIAYVSSLQNRHTLYFPAGIYKVSETIAFDYPGFKVVGDGRYNSIIKYTGNTIAVKFTDAQPNNGAFAFGGQIEDICIEGNASSTSLLYIKNVNHFLARNVNLRESSTTAGVGLHVLGTVAGCFDNIVCSSNAQLMTSRPNSGIVVDRDPTTLTRATDNVFTNCIIEGMSGDGIQLINSDQSMFLGGTLENNIGNGVTISAGSRMNTFISVAFENAIGFADIYDNGYSNKFINCYTKKLIYSDTASLFHQVSGGFHQSITAAGDFATLENLKYSFFGVGGAITVTQNTSTKNLYNVQTSALTFFKKTPVSVTLSASPATYTNGTGGDVDVVVFGGTVSQIVFNRSGPIANVPVSGVFRLAPADSLVISYTVAPTVTAIPTGTQFS